MSAASVVSAVGEPVAGMVADIAAEAQAERVGLAEYTWAAGRNIAVEAQGMPAWEVSSNRRI